MQVLLEDSKEAPEQGETIEASIQLFLREARSRNCAANTIKIYEGNLGKVEAYLRQQHGIGWVSEIKTAHLTEIIHGDMKLKPRSKNTRIDVLKVWLNFCVRQEWIPFSPAAEGRLRRVPTDGFCRTALTKDEIRIVRHAIEQVPDPCQRCEMRALFLLMIYSGLRISDAVALGRTQINLKTGVLEIQIQKTKRNYQIELHAEACRALRLVTPIDGPKFFGNNLTDRVAYDNYREALVAILSNALGKRVTPHWLRDTFAVTLLEAGADIYDVSQLLGHSSVEVTQRRYVSRTPKDRIAATLAKLSYGTKPASMKLKKVS